MSTRPIDWTTVMRIKALAAAEDEALEDRALSRQERACRQATRDAYRLVLDLIGEEGE